MIDLEHQTTAHRTGTNAQPLPSDLWMRARAQIQAYSESRTGVQSRGKAPTPEILDYQTDRVEELVARLQTPGCTVLHDPTGTGKTIVALVAALLLLDSPHEAGTKIARTLVIAPNETVAKLWADRAIRAGFTWTDVNVHTAGSLPSGKRQRLVISTRATVPPPVGQSARHELLVIVDEAHRGLQKPEGKSFQRLAKVASGTRVLLVTATPFQLSASGFATMLELSSNCLETTETRTHRRRIIEGYGEAVVGQLRSRHNLLLDPDNQSLKGNLDKATQREVNLRPMKDEVLSAQMMSAYDREAVGLPCSIRAPKETLIGPPRSWLLLYHVARLLPELTDNAQASDSFLRMLCSSHEAFLSTQAFGAFADSYEESSLLERIETLMTPDAHPKVSATANWVVERLKQNRHVLVFCVYVKTQTALRLAIARRFGDDSVVQAPATASAVQKIHSQRFGRRPGGDIRPLALVVRDNLSEGIDLDGGNPCIVHHDLCWNPARMAQRMGRVTRAATGFWIPKERDVFVPVLDLGLDRRLFDTMTNRGALSYDVLASLPPNMDDYFG